MPKMRSTQQSCSMSFSPGKRGDPFNSSPMMQPTALWVQNTEQILCHGTDLPHQLQHLTPGLHVHRCRLSTKDLNPRTQSKPQQP